IALLQKQQMEQAARRPEASQKEKPKRPPKKRAESHEAREGADPAEGDSLERSATQDSISRSSMDSARNAKPPIRRSTSHQQPEIEPIREREPFSDANDADQSAAGETTEDA